MILHKLFLVIILSSVIANALSVDEILTQDRVQPSFDCAKVIDNGKNDDELYICNEIGVRNGYENKRLALTDSMYGSYYRLVTTHIDTQGKIKLKNIAQNMIKSRKQCLMNSESWQALPNDTNPIIPLVEDTDCMQECYLKALRQITEFLYTTPQYKLIFERIFYLNPKEYYETIQSKNIADIIDKMAHDKLIDKTGKLIVSPSPH